MKVKLSELKQPKKNVRIHPKKQIDEIAKSVEMFGQIRPIVVDEKKEILAGNGLFEAMKKLGKKNAKVLKLTNLSSTDKKKLMLVDNKLFSLGFDDRATINELLEELGEAQDFDIPGFDSSVLETLFESNKKALDSLENYGNMDGEQFKEVKGEAREMAVRSDKIKIVEDEGRSRAIVKCPKCGHRIYL